MDGDNVEALCAGVAALDLTNAIPVTFLHELSNSNSSPGQIKRPSGRKTIRAKQSKSSNATNEDTATNISTRVRKDSHSGNDNDAPANESSEVETLNSELERLKMQNKGLRKEAERYKVELEQARSQNHSISGELEDKKAELATYQQKLDFIKQQSSYGTEDIDFNERSGNLLKTRFNKVHDRDNRLTTVTLEADFKVTLSKTLTFLPKISWGDDGNLYKSNDTGAVAMMCVSGKLCAAKCGKKQEQHLEMFIHKTRWTEAVMSLSKVIGSELKWGWAQHAELQLIAFYLGQVFEASGFDMADVENPKAYKACPRLLHPVTIYADQGVCNTCVHFVGKINEITKKYGLEFTVTNTGQSHWIN